MADQHTPQGLAQIRAELNELRRLVRVALTFSGTQIYKTIQQLRDLIDNLAEEIEGVSESGATWKGPVDTTGAVVATSITASGQGTFVTGLSSPGAFNLDVAGLPGTRTDVWQHESGAYGYTSSSRTRKTNISPAPYTAAQFLACMPVVFNYLAQIAIRDDPTNPYYNPEYIVPVEVGHIAETLIENDLDLFVSYSAAGEINGIHYSQFGAVAAVIIGREHAANLASIEARLTAGGL